jgi:hypothetical protein
VDQDQTAFITPFGIYRFTRLPFSVRNAPLPIQKLIDRFMVGLHRIITLAYLDDRIILSPTYEKHLENLRKRFQQLSRLRLVLETLQKYNLTLRIEKCVFFGTQIDYLVREISAEGVRPRPFMRSYILSLIRACHPCSQLSSLPRVV